MMQSLARRTIGCPNGGLLQRYLSVIPKTQRTTCGPVPITTNLLIKNPDLNEKFPMYTSNPIFQSALIVFFFFFFFTTICICRYQVMDLNGKILPGAAHTHLSTELAQKMYRTMIRVQALDDVFYNAQVRTLISRMNSTESVTNNCLPFHKEMN